MKKPRSLRKMERLVRWGIALSPDLLQPVPFIRYDPETGAIHATGQMARVCFDEEVYNGGALILGEADWESQEIDLATLAVRDKPKPKAAAAPDAPPGGITQAFVRAFIKDHATKAQRAKLTPALRAFVDQYAHLAKD